MSKVLITYVQQRGFDLKAYGYDVSDSVEHWLTETRNLEEEQDGPWQYLLINSEEISDEFAKKWEGDWT